MNYREAREKLLEMMHRNPVMFNMAVTYIVDVGYRNIAEIDLDEVLRVAQKDEEEAKESGHILLMTPEFQTGIVELAKEIVKVASPSDILVFSKDCMPWNVTGPTVEDLSKVLYNVINYAYEDTIGSYSWDEWLNILAYECGLEREDLEEMMSL